MKTVALIPVRGGSKSIPGKNIKLLAGKPLLHYVLEAALGAGAIDEVHVSSDSDEILRCADLVASSKVRTLRRPAELATDTASTESVMLQFAANCAFDRLVLIQATSPLTTSADLDGALGLMDRTRADSLVTVTREHKFLWTRVGDSLVSPSNYQPVTRPRRQDWDGELVENGAFYVSSREQLLATGCRLHGKVAAWVMDAQTSIELDRPTDWDLLEAILVQRRLQTQIPGDIELIVSDVDGVLTDAGMYYGREGDLLKKFNTKDGMGIRLWQEAGFRFAVMTGENSQAVAERMKKLKVRDYYPAAEDKLSRLRELSNDSGISLKRMAFIGDDVNDLPAMGEAGFAACPRNAHPKVRSVARWVSSFDGGSGCVRELVDALMAAKL